MHEIVEIIYGTAEYDNVVRLRDAVLRRPLGLQYTAEQLADEADQRHFALFDAGRPLACLIAAPLGDSRFKLRQMAVDPAEQGHGLGRRLVERVEQLLSSEGAMELTLHARETAVGFYEKLGYEKHGEPFLEIGIRHAEMRKQLA